MTLSRKWPPIFIFSLVTYSLAHWRSGQILNGVQNWMHRCRCSVFSLSDAFASWIFPQCRIIRLHYRSLHWAPRGHVSSLFLNCSLPTCDNDISTSSVPWVSLVPPISGFSIKGYLRLKNGPFDKNEFSSLEFTRRRGGLMECNYCIPHKRSAPAIWIAWRHGQKVCESWRQLGGDRPFEEEYNRLKCW
jgi:hypothetical protein